MEWIKFKESDMSRIPVRWYLVKYLHTVECVVYFNGHQWRKTGRPDIRNDVLDPPEQYFPYPEPLD